MVSELSFGFIDFIAASLPGQDGSGLLNLYQVKTSNWFEIEKEKPYWIVTSTSNIYDIGNQLGGEYYCDDQTFAEASYTFFLYAQVMFQILKGVF